jgi:hypothetical protein
MHTSRYWPCFLAYALLKSFSVLLLHRFESGRFPRTLVEHLIRFTIEHTLTECSFALSYVFGSKYI